MHRPGDLRTATAPARVSAPESVVAALRAAGFHYSPRHHLLTLRGARTLTLPFRYTGADPTAGPNYTGQPAVASHYEH